MKTFAFIFAHELSKSILNKNIKKIFGKSLIFYSIQKAKKIKQIDKYFVSLDFSKMLKFLKNKVLQH